VKGVVGFSILIGPQWSLLASISPQSTTLRSAMGTWI